MVLMNYIRVNRTAPLFTLLWQLLFFVMGAGLVIGINTFLNEDPTFACIGTLMALMAVLVGALARGNLNGHTRFRLAVSMGNTRRSYLLCDPLITALTSLIGVLVAWVMYLCEKALYAVLFPGFVDDMSLDSVFTWQVILIIVAAAVVMDLVLSALTLRFGPTGFLVIWLPICVSSLVLPRMLHAYEDGSNSLLAQLAGVLLTAIKTIPGKGWIAIGIALLLAMIVFAINTFRKAEVKL